MKINRANPNRVRLEEIKQKEKTLSAQSGKQKSALWVISQAQWLRGNRAGKPFSFAQNISLILSFSSPSFKAHLFFFFPSLICFFLSILQATVKWLPKSLYCSSAVSYANVRLRSYRPSLLQSRCQ